MTNFTGTTAADGAARADSPRRTVPYVALLRKKMRRVATRLMGPIRRRVIKTVRIEDVPGAQPKIWDLDREPVETPDAARMQMLPKARDMRRAIYVPPPARTAILEDVGFFPYYHALFRSQHELLAESVSTYDHAGFVSLLRLWSARSERLKGLFTTFRSYQNTHYHTLIDNLPRLYLLHLLRPELEGQIEVLHSGNLSRAEASLAPRLLPEGARLRQVPGNRYYQVERFAFLGFLSRQFAGHLPRECLDWYRDRLVPPRPSKRSKRILISRVPTATRFFRCILNEDELMERLEPLGFERWVLEDMAIDEQIELFHDAECVIGAHGAGLANLVFARDVKVIELFPTQYVVPHYYHLCKACKHTYASWRASERHRNSHFHVDVNEIERLVRRLDRG